MAYLESLPVVPLLSVIVVAELFSGVRDGQERTLLETLVASAHALPIDERIATQAGLLRRQHRLSHRPDLPDMLIAATVLAYNATLVTLNSKHFPMLQDMRLEHGEEAPDLAGIFFLTA